MFQRSSANLNSGFLAYIPIFRPTTVENLEDLENLENWRIYSRDRVQRKIAGNRGIAVFNLTTFLFMAVFLAGTQGPDADLIDTSSTYI